MNFAAIQRLHQDGYTMLESVFDSQRMHELIDRLSYALDTNDEGSVLRTRGTTYGSRNLISAYPDIVDVLRHNSLVDFAREALGNRAGLVRALYFDKPPGRTWSLPWHKDKTIAVKRNDLPSRLFSKPTVKANVAHVEAPASVLSQMLTFRIHLDAMTEENGPLSVIPGSHLDDDQADPQPVANPRRDPIRLAAAAGDVLAMRPLLSHASSSSAAKTQQHRRIVHFELAAQENLADKFEWQTFVPLE